MFIAEQYTIVWIYHIWLPILLLHDKHFCLSLISGSIYVRTIIFPPFFTPSLSSYECMSLFQMIFLEYGDLCTHSSFLKSWWKLYFLLSLIIACVPLMFSSFWERQSPVSWHALLWYSMTIFFFLIFISLHLSFVLRGSCSIFFILSHSFSVASTMLFIIANMDFNFVFTFSFLVKSSLTSCHNSLYFYNIIYIIIFILCF